MLSVILGSLSLLSVQATFTTVGPVTLHSAGGIAVGYDASLKILNDQNIDDAKIQIITNQFNEIGVSIDAKSVVGVLACPIGSPVDCIRGFAQTLEDEKKQKILEKISYFDSLCSKGTSSSGTAGTAGDKAPIPEHQTEEPKTEEPKTEEPKTEEPKTEEPKTEEPKTEEPHTEEPHTEEPKTQEPEPVTGESPPAGEGQDVLPPPQKDESGTPSTGDEQNGMSSNPDDYTLPPKDQNSTDYTPSTNPPSSIDTLTAPPALQKKPEVGTTVLPPSCDGGKNETTKAEDGQENAGTSSAETSPEDDVTNDASDPDKEDHTDESNGTSSPANGADKGSDPEASPKKPGVDLPKKKPEMPVSDNPNSGNRSLKTNSVMAAISIIFLFVLF